MVWMGPRFPYYCRLAVESVLVAMPHARVQLHLVAALSADPHLADVDPHLARVAADDRVELVQRPTADIFAGAPGGATRYLDLLDRVRRSPAAISNLVRLAVLGERGGIYLDTDILVTAPLPSPTDVGDFVGREHVWADNRRRIQSGYRPGVLLRSVPWAATWLLRRSDSRLSQGRFHLAERLPAPITRLQVNNAVIGAEAGSPFVQAALRRSLGADPRQRFALGPSLLDDLAAAEPRLVRLLPPSRFYPVPPGQSYRYFEDRHLELPADTKLIHYVSSNHRGMLHRLDEHDPRFESNRAQFWRIAQHVRVQHVGRRSRLRSVNG